MACFMCMGTDCAGSCDQGYCYAEEMQRRWEEEEAERRYYEELYEDGLRASEVIERFAVALAAGTRSAETTQLAQSEGCQSGPKRSEG